ncbi:MAG: hypothetical protein MUP53_08850 [Bacteroidales bacterium]|nr:hypothetical protein [Bacteroidales bacterium]
MNYKFFPGIFLFIILSGCENDKCKENILPTKHFENEFDCVDTRHNLSIDLTDNCTVIRSTQSYDDEVSGICHPEVNFSFYDLAIGKQATAKQVDTIYYDLRIKCPENELTLTVDIIQSAVALPDNVVYHALIPKLGDEEALYVIVNIK